MLLLLSCVSSAVMWSAEQTWTQAINHYNRAAVYNRLGYDPCITVYRDSHDSSVVNDGCTIFCHGFGGSQRCIQARHVLGLLPGTIVGFNFFDAGETGITLFTKSCFAQENDIKTLLVVLALLDDAACPAFHLVGFSLGGGVIINMLARLVQYKKYGKFFHKLGISKSKADSIIARIKNGTIVLDCPLVDIFFTLKERMPNICGLLHYIILPAITQGKYLPWKDTALKAAPIVRGLEIPILVHFQYGDEIVTNRCDIPFYTSLCGADTYVVLGNDGGHMHDGKTLNCALQAFRKQYHGPYYDDEKSLELGALLLNNGQPLLENIVSHISDYYSFCAHYPK
jgi:hypothetical protein